MVVGEDEGREVETGRYIVSFAPEPEAVARTISDLHDVAGIARGSLALDSDHARVDARGSAGTIMHRFGFGVLEHLDEATTERLRGRNIKVRRERYFRLPRSHNLRRYAEPEASTIQSAVEPQTASWALNAIGGVDAPYTGKDVRVAVVDSGIWAQHPDFAGRQLEARGFAPGVADANDELGHGTFCAGLIAGPVAPAKGPRYGVAPGVQLVCARVLRFEQPGAREHDIIQAIGWAIDSGCRVVSLSLGALPGAEPDPDYDKIGDDAKKAGCLIIAAAGNDSVRPQILKPVSMPANSPSIIAVGALTRGKFPYSTSNEGNDNGLGGKVDLSAPGADVYSALVDPSDPTTLYGTADGTSAATPFVAGVAAHWLEREPTLRPGNLIVRILQTCQAAAQDVTTTSAGAGLVRAPAKP